VWLGGAWLMASVFQPIRLWLAVVIAPATTFAMLHRQGVAIGSQGVFDRAAIEHPQPMVDQARWGPRRASTSGRCRVQAFLTAANGTNRLTASAVRQGVLVVGRRLRSRPMVVTNGNESAFTQ